MEGPLSAYLGRTLINLDLLIILDGKKNPNASLPCYATLFRRNS